MTVAFFAFYLVILLKEILILSLFGLVISILFEIPIRVLTRKIPRGLAVAFVYILTFTALSFLFYLPASSIVNEVKNFVKLFPVYFEQVSPPLKELGIEAFQDLERFVAALESSVQVLTSNILNVLFSIFGGIASTVYVLSIAIFLSLEGKSIEEALILFFSKKDQRAIRALWRNAQKRVGLWFLRTGLGCLFVGVVSYLSFLAIKIDYPLSLSIIGGAFNFVPIVGPILASVVIFIILAFESLPKAFFALIAYVVIQQIENNIVGPLLTKKLVGISPALVLISLAAGQELLGILGALLMVPLIAIMVEFIKGLLERRREAETLKT